jgi:hypothetical protein
MCNISAALRDSGNDYVTGYKPRSGYQRSLLDVLAQLAPHLVPYQVCTECDSVMNYSPARKPICSLCQPGPVYGADRRPENDDPGPYQP